uniref:Uncharacterized protein n=1 Tax=Sphaerodactylus townsendi TaxID=933632 RepID=A0ACB8FX01_9SAUR
MPTSLTSAKICWELNSATAHSCHAPQRFHPLLSQPAGTDAPGRAGKANAPSHHSAVRPPMACSAGPDQDRPISASLPFQGLWTAPKHSPMGTAPLPLPQFLPLLSKYSRYHRAAP